MNKIVCVTGMPGAGKSVLSDYFVDKGYKFVRFGQITLDEIKRKGLKPNEKNERKIRETFRKKHGMAAHAILNYSKFYKLLKRNHVIADGLYSWAEYKYLKKRFGDQMIVVAVYAPPKMRHIRISLRKMPKEDTDLRNRPFTTKEAEKRDYAEIEKLDKGGSIAMADYTVVNIKDKKYFRKQIRNLYKEIYNKRSS